MWPGTDPPTIRSTVGATRGRPGCGRSPVAAAPADPTAGPAARRGVEMPNSSSPTVRAIRVRAVRVPMWPELSAGLLCCTPTAHWLEYAEWWNGVLAEPLRVENGTAMVDDAPGDGLDWDEDAVSRFAA